MAEDRKEGKFFGLSEDDLFGGGLGFLEEASEEEIAQIKKERSQEISMKDLRPFKNHPFKLYEGKRLDDMVESIREFGIINPLIVRPLAYGRYEILSGHNRANAGKIAGLDKVAAIVKEGLTDEEAMLIVTETNLIQRSFSELSHSEKARILSERHRAIKRQGKRMDLIDEIEDFRRIYEKKRSDVELGLAYDLSPRNVSNYLRIDGLIKELKERLDRGEIPFTAAVDLSFISKEEQLMLEGLLVDGPYDLNLKKSDLIKKLSREKKLSKKMMEEILSGSYFKKEKKEGQLKLRPAFTNKIIRKYFKVESSQDEVEDIIDKALEEYFKKRK